jgi:hypothetical protein
MAYGSVKVDTIIFDNAGVDQNVTVSGLYRATTSGITVSGTISGATVIGSTLVSGSTVTGTVIQGTTIQGVSGTFTSLTGTTGTFTSLTGTTTTGTTANFVSGVFTTRISGLVITGNTGQFTSGSFTSLVSTTGDFASVTGTTILGTTGTFTSLTGTTGTFTSLTGTTITGTTANFVSGVFTDQVSGTTITGTTASFTTGTFTTLSGAVTTFTSGIVGLGSVTNPSLSFSGDINTGFYSPGADTLAFVEGGVESLRLDSSGNIGIGTTTITERLTISGNTTITGDVKATSYNGGALAGTRNRIINGDMRISQRGTSFPAAANAYNLDRWQWAKLGAMVCTVSQDSNVPNTTFQNSYKVDVTTVDTSISSTDYAVIIQRIEGYNVRDLIGTTFTLSFWVKSPKTGTHCVGFRNNLQDRSFVTTYSITTINTWEYKTITVTDGLITAGGWDWTNGTGLEIAFILASGSTYQTTANSWNTGNFLATSAQVNVMDNVANDFFLTGVQLEPGTVATPFERRSIEQELQFCYRYFRLLSYYGGAFTGANVCYFSPEGISDFRGDPAISSTINSFQFYNGSIWTAVGTGTGATLSIYSGLTGTRAILVTGLTGNGTLSTPTSAGIIGTLSAEL